jgi:heme oxygenase
VSENQRTAPSAPFSERLRLDTRDSRDQAESAGYFRLLLSGALEPDEYAALLFQYHGVYVELRRLAEALRDDPYAGPFVHGCGSCGHRVEELEADLHALLGPQWRERAYLTDAATAYRERVRAAAGSPAKFVAHHYVRYLSELSAGQLIRAAVTDAYDLGGSAAGASSFGLPAGKSAHDLKREYRALLDAAPWSAADQALIVAEARTAFQLNAAVAAALSDWIASGAAASKPSVHQPPGKPVG